MSTNSHMHIRTVPVYGLVLLWLATIVGIVPLRAQTTTATILGTVSDSSGAVIVGATVQVKNTDTSITQSTVTDGQGRYRVADLIIGTYDVQSMQPGFQVVIHRGVTLTVGGQTVVDFSLPAGGAQQTVTVQGEAAQVETTTTAVDNLVSPTQMSQLPLNGRDFESLYQLAPGVQTVNTGNHNAFYGTANEYSVAGQRPEGAAELLDDQDLDTYWNHGSGAGSLGTDMGVAAIAEFTTLLNTYGAQFGGDGAVINATTRSGTNSLHGSVYEFLRNSALDARNFNDPAKIPEFRRNQFGASLGGPIKKDKAFFFLNYEGLRETTGITATALVPDAAARQGYLPTGPSGALKPVNASCPAYSVAANCITSPLVAALLPLWPTAPAGAPDSGGVAQVTQVASQQGREDYGVARIDYTLSAKDSFFGRYIIDNAFRSQPFNAQATAIPTWPELDYTQNQYFVIEEKHIFSPALINSVRFAFSRPNSSAQNAPSTTPALAFFPGRQDGYVSASPLSSIGTDNLHIPFNFPVNRFDEGDDIIWTRGAHTLQFGMDVLRNQYNDSAPFYLGGSYTFNSEAALLTATPASYSATVPGVTSAFRYIRELELTPYIQDQWQATKQLTLNLGLRYQWQGNPTCWPCNEVIQPTTAVAAPPTYGYTLLTNSFQNNISNKNFAPRLGFAFDPYSDHKTVLRGGFGMFYDLIEARTYQTSFWSAPPNYEITFTNPTVFPVPNQAVSLSALPSQGLSSGGAYFANKTPYSIQYNLNIQRQIWGSTIMTLGYVGSQGVGLIVGLDQNPLRYTINAAGQQQFATLSSANRVVPNPRQNPNTLYGAMSQLLPKAHSSYNSLLFGVNHPLSRNVQAQVNYTWSKCMDDSSVSANQESATTGQAVSDPYDLSVDRGRCAFDTTQAVRVNGVVQLPFHGNDFVEGWQVATIFSGLTGSPFNVEDGFNWSGIGAGTRPNVVPGCNPMAGEGTRTQWYNPACFTIQPVGTLGNYGRDVLSLPSTIATDFSVIKDTMVPRISEAFDVQFRAEFFNIINYQNLGAPVLTNFQQSGATATINPTAGLITIPQNGTPSRQIQFALKILF